MQLTKQKGWKFFILINIYCILLKSTQLTHDFVEYLQPSSRFSIESNLIQIPHDLTAYYLIL